MASTRNEKLYHSIRMMASEDEQAEGSSKISNPTIFQVPKMLRILKESAYTPRAVSIGPFHHKGGIHLEDMEQHKVSYMYSLFRRTSNGDTNRVDQKMRECADAMLEMVGRARTCYAACFRLDVDDDNFAKIMLVDGCFVLEFLYRYWLQGDRACGDPFFRNSLMVLYINHDMLLLENQLPFFALQKLFQFTIEQITPNDTGIPRNLPDLVLAFYASMINNRTIDDTSNVGHILGLLHKCYLPHNLKPARNVPVIQYTATELDRAGIKLKAGGQDLEVKFNPICMFSWLFRAKILIMYIFGLIATRSSHIPPLAVDDTTATRSTNCLYWPGNWFAKHSPEITPSINETTGTSSSHCCCLSWLCHCFGGHRFEIPPLRIDDTTEPFLRNLIAFEQCYPGIPRHVTSYAALIHRLVNSTKDFELLEKARVVQNNLGASEDASNLINNICKEVHLGEFFFFEQWKEVDKYCNRFWPRHLASLRCNYFNSPWALLSIIAALLLFALTVMQTVYTIRASNN